MRRAIIISVVAALVGASSGASAQLAPSQFEEERKGRAAFAAGRYEDSLEVFARLYAEYQDPIYLRNIGRCYQKLRNPERGIAAFEEYLVRKKVTDQEREEIAGFILELKQMQLHEAPAGAPQAPAPPPVSTPTLVLPPPLGYPPAPTPVPPRLLPVYETASAPSRPRSRGWRRAGQVTLVASAVMTVAAGVVLMSSLAKFSDADAQCSAYATTACYDAVKSIRSRNLIAGGLFMGAALGAATGAFMILLQPTESPGSTALSGAVLVGAGRF